MNAGNLLSPRQREIVGLAGSGLTDREIADRLGLAVSSLRTHWDRIRARLGAATRGEAIARLGADAREGLAQEVALLQRALSESRLLAWAARADGFVDYASASFREMCGRPASALIGVGCLCLMPEGQLEASAERWRRANASQEGYEARVLFRDGAGEFLPHLIRIAPLETRDGAVVRWMGTARPIEAAPSGAVRSTILSPLSGGRATAEPCGTAPAPGLWLLVRETDGTRFVASARWLSSAGPASLSDVDREQARLAARYCPERGETLVLLAPEEERRIERAALGPSTIPWLVRG